MTLTVYSKSYDNYSYCVGYGMSGKVLLEANGHGCQFATVNDALDYAVKNGIKIDEILFMYQVHGEQLFKRFSFKTEPEDVRS